MDSYLRIGRFYTYLSDSYLYIWLSFIYQTPTYYIGLLSTYIRLLHIIPDASTYILDSCLLNSSNVSTSMGFWLIWAPIFPGNGNVLSKVQVQGKQKILGMLKASSSSAVKQTMYQVTDCAKEKVQTQHTFKNLHNNKICWWHVVSDDGNGLEKFEKEWEVVKLQTGWTLEKCFMDNFFFWRMWTPHL